MLIRSVSESCSFFMEPDPAENMNTDPDPAIFFTLPEILVNYSSSGTGTIPMRKFFKEQYRYLGVNKMKAEGSILVIYSS